MEKPKDFDTARATGEFKPLPAGGYVCEIIGVDETMSKTGKKMIKIALDIAEGDEKGRFMESYKSDTREFKKWPAGAVVYQLTEDPEGNTHGRFKQFTNCVTDSNKGFEIRWGKEFGACFKGKQVGVIFGREQYESPKDGSLRWSTKPQFFKTVAEIRDGDFKVPEDKTLPSGSAVAVNAPEGFSEITDDDIPF
jgi:hypothetical protein